jgi:hypothetical protein
MAPQTAAEENPAILSKPHFARPTLRLLAVLDRTTADSSTFLRTPALSSERDLRQYRYDAGLALGNTVTRSLVESNHSAFSSARGNR